MVDYAYKSYVLNNFNDIVVRQRKATLCDFANSALLNDGVLMPFLARVRAENETSVELLNYCINNGLEKVYFESIKINNANYKRVKRLKERISDMLLSGSCIFLTLTFNDETLRNTSADTRRRYVRKYLKLFNARYVGNIDFGKENGREHYHALINCDKINYSLWVYGAINGQRVRNRDIKSDKTKLAKYIAKLTNHAIKETTHRNSLLYSR